MLKKIFQINIVRQLFGAVMGAGIAYGAYSGYGMAENAVRAYLASPNNTSSEQVSVDLIREQTQASSINLVALAPKETNSFVETISSVASNNTFVAAAISSRSQRLQSSVSSISTERPAQAMREAAPALPSSGFGLWLATLCAFFITAFSFFPERLKKVCTLRKHMR